MHEREAAEHGCNACISSSILTGWDWGRTRCPNYSAAAERMGFAGLNITHPCKQSVLPLLTDLSDDARALGAVNTVVLRDGRRWGHNTDWLAFSESFRRGLPGAAIAAHRATRRWRRGRGHRLRHAENGRRPHHHPRSRLRPRRRSGRTLQFHLRRTPRLHLNRPRRRPGHCRRLDSRHAHRDARPSRALRWRLLCSAAISGLPRWSIFPLETELLRAARAAGCPTLEGSGMAVHQAVGSLSPLFRTAARRRTHAPPLRLLWSNPDEPAPVGRVATIECRHAVPHSLPRPRPDLGRDHDQLPGPHRAWRGRAGHGNRSAYFPGGHGYRLLRILLELCRGADPGRMGSRPHRHAPDLFPCGHSLVAVHPGPGFRQGHRFAADVSPRTWRE